MATHLILIAGTDPRQRAQLVQRLLEQHESAVPSSAPKLTLLANSEVFGSMSVAEQNQLFELDLSRKARGIHVLRLAPGCLCCSSRLVLSTQVGRTLRLSTPDVLLLELDSRSHANAVKDLFGEAQWQGWFSQLELVDAGAA